MGIASCGCQGAQKFINGKSRNRLTLITLMIANGFGGGLLRDIVLGVHPVLFTTSILPDVFVAVASGLLYFHFHKKQRWLDKLVDIFDALGLGTFIAIGVDKAFSMNMSGATVILSGLLTALGGGIIAGLLNGRKLSEVISVSGYRVITLVSVQLYTCILRSGFGPLTGQALLICIVCLGLGLQHYDIQVPTLRRVLSSCALLFSTIPETWVIICGLALFFEATCIWVKRKKDTADRHLRIYTVIRKPQLHRLLM